LKLAKHGQSKGVTLRKSTESAMWAGSPPHRVGHERYPRYSVLYDFSLVGGGRGKQKRQNFGVFSQLLSNYEQQQGAHLSMQRGHDLPGQFSL